MDIGRPEGDRVTGITIREAYFPVSLKKLPPRKESEEFVRQRLSDYPGQYEFGRYGQYEVTQENGGLFGRLGQQNRIPLRILNRDDFEVEGVGARFSVVRDTSGKIISADFRQHGMLIEAPKVK